jgi:hypothetical protein
VTRKFVLPHQKGIEMKLIQILALATAMATMATAQNSSANGQKNGAKPSPTATPTASNNGAKPATGSKTSPATATAKPGTAAPAKAGSPAKGGGESSVSTGKAVTVKTGSVPAKKPASAPQGAVVKVKATPTPVVPAKSTATAKGATPAQSGTAAKPGTTAAKNEKKPAVIAVKPAQNAAKKGGATPAKATTKTSSKTPAAAPAPASKTAQPATAGKEEKPKPVVRAYGAHGRRDPFVSPIRDRGPAGPIPNCTTGKRCLAIPELVLQGTVKDVSGKMLAVVANSTKRTYFLRENDQVFNGSVEKITSDSIIFREYGKDALGRETAREVVKKLVPTT